MISTLIATKAEACQSRVTQSQPAKVTSARRCTTGA